MTTATTFSPHDVMAIRWMPRREGTGERSEPYDRGAEDILGVMREVSILLALIGGEDPAHVMRLAQASAAPEWLRSGMPTLDREERKQLELRSASELHSTVDEEEVFAVGE